MKTFVLAAVLLGCLAATLPGQMKYGVKVEADKKTDFAKLKTYTWSTRYSALDKDVHAQVVEAIERELAAVGLTKQATGPGDVVVVYDAQRRTDMDLKAKPVDGAQAMYPVGLLIVRMLEPGTDRVLYRAEALQPISVQRDRLAEEIKAIVSSMFKDYPRPGKR